MISSKPKKYEDGKEKSEGEDKEKDKEKDGDDGEKGEEEEVLDPEILREDRIASAGIDAITREYKDEIKASLGGCWKR